ncbi:MAG: hypothetical protein M0P50_10290 [Bacteroidales bacterium]|nr:hypothetical protein [Bacteroidales bacterium]MDY0143909.1 hypothetical protein [Bacteroidales bacterium]
MRNPAITLANDTHGKTPVGRLSLEKDFGIIGQQASGHQSSKATEIYIHVTENTFKNFKNPVDELN